MPEDKDSPKKDDKKDESSPDGEQLASPSKTSLTSCPPLFPRPDIKCIDDLYADGRATSKVLMYLMDNRDRDRVMLWINKLDQMTDEAGQLERLLYIKYLVDMLSGLNGLTEPFTMTPPETLKPLRNILPPIVFADLIDEDSTHCRAERSRCSTSRAPIINQPDRDFYYQQLFPPEGLFCYAAAFSADD
ncbi:uncharacterized protein LOC126840061 [Adelges cooleyi]|uniref:uncharacterized protein LOC126840061 n=1 Tax=Adelges cooleyi TaxID=133065 RepID=UPI00217F9AAA|nr:uncharacterized protein LOC126840061 [Adelges cooleyi]